MSLRHSHPEDRAAHRFCLTFAFRKGTRSISIRPTVFYIVIGVLPVLCLWYLFATVYLIFRDDMLASLMNRQTEMQYAYEDRIGTLRAELDKVARRRLLDETELSTKMDDLTTRQARLEQRSAIVTSLAERVLPKQEAKAMTASLPVPISHVESHATKKAAVAASANPLLTGAFSTDLPQAVSAFAPVETTSHETAPPSHASQLNATQLNVPAKPRPDGFDLRHSEDSDFAPSVPGKVSDARDPEDSKDALARITASLDRLESDQDRIVARLQTPLMGELARVRTVLAEAGLSADRLSSRDSVSPDEHKWHDPKSKSAPLGTAAVGGPFVPLTLDPGGSAFEREAVSLQDAILAVEHLRRAISSVPLRKPLAGDPEVTSGFGARLDPFFGRPAMHTGIDLREDYGTDVHATAAGKVTIAAAEGGYGNMVEIDHGNGLSTRYAHLASTTVSEGQTVQAGQVVGHIGMTGRTTGPHLHYETRIDGEPVDPLRFLKAGARLFSEAPESP